MTARTRLVRLIAGLALVAAILIVAFAVLLPWMHHWGATDAEIAGTFPGDDLLTQPTVNWTHAIDIKAPPEQVWPWIAQMGEGRGGFYSYTFIENIVAGKDVYHNANRIVPELQQPAPGDTLIGGMMSTLMIEPGQWLLGSAPAGDFGWTWLWSIAPYDTGQTRLVIRMKIQSPPEMNNPIITFVFDAGGFIMERKMMEGIKLRAEGGTEQPFAQVVEIILWAIAFLAGVAAGVLFLIQRRWLPPLVVGIAAVLVLLALTYWQPALWIRIILDIGLLAGLWWTRRAN